MEEPISPSDEKYFGIASNGTNTLRFPADNAPLSAKKAWVEAMKSLTPDEQFMAKTEIFIRVPSRAFGLVMLKIL
ncbi:MAG TPA: hypothetical protein PKA28_06600 [Methylomusa anaerophila]|nr:hypothetical protein [Methylomusa anaerophila]HML88105.1 hypothetical protein [Methylomusa anaerophila]